MKSGAVELANTVAEGDVDTDGVSIPRDALRFNGGRIAGTNGNTRVPPTSSPMTR